MKKIFTILSTILILAIASCEEDLPSVTDPQQAILGRWELIENSFGPKSYPGTYTEYRRDSVLFYYVSEDDFSYSQYWFEDSILFEQTTYYINEGPGYEDTLVSTLPYKFEFLNYDRLKLELQTPALVTTFIYKRIN